MSAAARTKPNPPEAPARLTVPEVARLLRVSEDKVRGWIERGELRAVNCAARAGGRPRWRVSREALAEFERLRSPRPTPTPRRRSAADGVIPFS
jgi:excisionase family DNA binding protein